MEPKCYYPQCKDKKFKTWDGANAHTELIHFKGLIKHKKKAKEYYPKGI